MTLQIVTSRISIYEVEVDVGSLAARTTRDLSNFTEKLVELIPSLTSHRCVAGEDGGFVKELRKGTDFAHVLEHVLLELQHLADPERRVYRGWTRRRSENGPESSIYVIHYEARDFLTGRLAAAMGVQLIKNLVAGQPVDIIRMIRQLEDPVSFYEERKKFPSRSIIPEIEILWESAKVDYLEVDMARQDFGTIDLPMSRETVLSGFSPKEKRSIGLALKHLRPHLSELQTRWLEKVSEFGGRYTESFREPIEALSMSPSILALENGQLQDYDRIVFEASRLLAVSEVPFSLVLHALQLYEEEIMARLLEVFPDREELADSWKGLQSLFHHHLMNISLAYFEHLHLKRAPAKRTPVHLL
ncbi:MAG: hypothetical protein U0V70_04605 [Terriglobia bacterium]